MLGNLSKTTNVTAISTVDGNVVLNIRATIDAEGTCNINKNIRNSELYLANKAECEADYEEFEAEVLKIAQA